VKNFIRRVKNFIVWIKIRYYGKIDGFLTRREAIALYKFANKLPSNSTVVEIGTWKGKSAFCLAKGLFSGTIYVIDPFDGTVEDGNEQLFKEKKGKVPLIDQFKTTMEKQKLFDKFILFKGLSSQFVGQVKDINLLFIDGDHSIKWCKHDFTEYAPYLIRGGYLILHDYDSSRKELGPTWVVENLIISSSKYKFIERTDSLWIAQKIA
jgi:predicted O-methyltransferase YrrM